MKHWPLGVAAFFVVMIGGTALPWFDWNKVATILRQLHRSPDVSLEPGPKVLLVSARESDRFSVSLTLQPRGYTLLLADNVEAGLEILDRGWDEIGLVVVDTSLPASKKLLQAAKTHCPRAPVIALQGPRQAGEVSAMLIDVAVH